MTNSETSLPTISDVIEFVREFAGLKGSINISPATKLDAELGITGDDGMDLLIEAAGAFCTQLEGEDGYITTFGLQPNAYLFQAEGLDLFGLLPAHTVRDLTVLELHEAICRGRAEAALLIIQADAYGAA